MSKISKEEYLRGWYGTLALWEKMVNRSNGIIGHVAKN
jgi:hypothetical protein